MSYLFIGHDLATVAHISHRIAVMYLGKIVEVADSQELCANPLHPYTKALFAAALPAHPDEARAGRGDCWRGPQCPQPALRMPFSSALPLRHAALCAGRTCAHRGRSTPCGGLSSVLRPVTPEGVKRLTLAFDTSIAPAYLKPAETTWIAAPLVFLDALHDPLVKLLPGNYITPCLAESWTESADGLVYEFKLLHEQVKAIEIIDDLFRQQAVERDRTEAGGAPASAAAADAGAGHARPDR